MEFSYQLSVIIGCALGILAPIVCLIFLFHEFTQEDQEDWEQEKEKGSPIFYDEDLF